MIRQKAGFPLIRGLSCGVTSVKTQTPLPFRSVGQVSTSVIEEHDVVFCEGY